MTGALRRVLCDCNRDVKSRAYTTLVRPKLEYASSAWNPRTKRNTNQIEMVQHRAARFVLHDYWAIPENIRTQRRTASMF